MSSRSSASVICRRSQTSIEREALAGAAGLDQDRGERDQAREALGADRGLALAGGRSPSSSASTAVARWLRDGRAELERLGVALVQQLDAVGDELGASSGGPSTRACSPRPQHPRGELALGRVRGREDDAVVRAVGLDGSRRSGRSGARPARRCARRRGSRPTPIVVAELPVGAVGVRARVEVGRALEVVLGLRRVGDLAADPRQAEDAQRVALVRVAEQVELAAVEQQVVRVDLARADLVALHRVVVEGDRLVAEDRGLDLGQALGQVVPARRRGDAERDRAAGRARAAGSAGPTMICCSASRSGSA